MLANNHKGTKGLSGSHCCLSKSQKYHSSKIPVIGGTWLQEEAKMNHNVMDVSAVMLLRKLTFEFQV